MAEFIAWERGIMARVYRNDKATVVADEVRSLFHRCSQAAKDTAAAAFRAIADESGK
jgi:hypothetical protein